MRYDMLDHMLAAHCHNALAVREPRLKRQPGDGDGDFLFADLLRECFHATPSTHASLNFSSKDPDAAWLPVVNDPPVPVSPTEPTWDILNVVVLMTVTLAPLALNVVGLTPVMLTTFPLDRPCGEEVTNCASDS